MSKAIVYSSITGQTKKLAQVINENVDDILYCGKPDEKAYDADVLFIGSYTIAFDVSNDIKKFVEGISNKKVFLFMTAGYGSDHQYLQPIIDTFKNHLNDTNEIIGTYICQGEVSLGKREAIKKMNIDKYNSMLDDLVKSTGTPSSQALDKLKTIIKEL